jgi:glycosyltransferase involved in cell wall biosynthesis
MSVPSSRPIELPLANDSRNVPVDSTPKPVTPAILTPSERIVPDGKFFRLGARKFYPKGVTYGPFKPDATGCTYPVRAQVEKDFELIRQLNANCIRVYHVPPRWFLDLAHEHGLKILVDHFWPKHLCFLDDPDKMQFARRATREAAEALKNHPAVFALTLSNEIPPDIVRWYGPKRVEEFLAELAGIVKAVDPRLLVTVVNFPTTEFLQPSCVDFVSFNVYLHDPQPFANYLDRLQSIAGDKPLVLSEFGLDSVREGEQHKAEVLSSHIEIAFRAGLAGTFIFAFTDDWHTGGHQIENWFFGLTDKDRNTRRSFQAVARQYKRAPYFPLPFYPKVSVVVASYNGGRTLPACLDSLTHLNYPSYEIILVDDGSTDDTAKIAGHYEGKIRAIHQPNLGLSVARNTGIAAATGEIIAFTDSDCRADEDWLYYLVGDLLKTDACAIGGHNFPPPEDNWIAGCVAVSPGGPAHVMLNDRDAEHIPGCNMAFWRWALDSIDGFDAQFRAAGDDVDVCWRLLQRGHRIAFTHSGFVWHYRRNTLGGYLKQQRGYGVAEALLRHKHPEFFNTLGGIRWRGHIYSPSKTSGLVGRSVIYHGVFGSALFQTLYTPAPVNSIMAMLSLEWHILFTLGGIVLTAIWSALWPLPVISFLASIGVSIAASVRANLPPKYRAFVSRTLVALLFLLQPIVRGWPRYAGRLRRSETPVAARETVRELARQYDGVGSRYTATFWNDKGGGRMEFLQKFVDLLDRHNWQSIVDSGWDEYDVTIYGDRFSKAVLITVAEDHNDNKRLVRARLTGHWTLLGKVFFGITVVTTVLAYGLSQHSNWTAPALLLIPLVACYLHLRTRRTVRLAIALLDICGKELGFVNMRDAKIKSESP